MMSPCHLEGVHGPDGKRTCANNYSMATRQKVCKLTGVHFCY